MKGVGQECQVSAAVNDLLGVRCKSLVRRSRNGWLTCLTDTVGGTREEKESWFFVGRESSSAAFCGMTGCCRWFILSACIVCLKI